MGSTSSAGGTLFDPADRAAIESRIAALRADSPRGWGRMTPAQALAHCTEGLRSGTGERPIRQLLLGRLLAPFLRGKMLGPDPFVRNAPTAKEFLVRDDRDLEVERARLLRTIAAFAANGPTVAARQTHGFLGRLAGEDWARLMWKHLDHHLRQFGV